MPRYKDAERDQIKEQARQRLLEAALTEFAAQGYSGANINRISQSAGFAQGTVYNYFPSKRALFEAVVLDIAERHSALILQGAGLAAEPAARLERFFASGFAFAQGLPAAARVIAAALHGPDPEIRGFVKQAYAPLLSFVEQEIVQTGLLERTFRPIDARLAAALIFSVYLTGCSNAEEAGRIRQNPRAVASLLLDGLKAG